MPEIVVGVDGSPGGDAALTWALQEAKLRNADVVAVSAWVYPTAATLSALATASIDPREFELGAKEVLAESVERVLGETGSHVAVRQLVGEGPAAQVLLDAAGAGADMIVVGSRGRGGFAGLLLGSVSQQVAHHATVPVVIVRD